MKNIYNTPPPCHAATSYFTGCSSRRESKSVTAPELEGGALDG